MGSPVRNPCPHCGSGMIADRSSAISLHCREIIYDCRNRDCNARILYQKVPLRTLRASLMPNPDFIIPTRSRGSPPLTDAA